MPSSSHGGACRSHTTHVPAADASAIAAAGGTGPNSDHQQQPQAGPAAASGDVVERVRGVRAPPGDATRAMSRRI